MTSKNRNAKKAHNQIVAEMIEGGKQAVAIMRGEADPSTYRVHLPADLDVKAVRQKTGLSQEAFAGTFGFSTGTVRDWEQRRNAPDQAARAYLYVISQKPDMVRKTLAPLKDGYVTGSGKIFTMKAVLREPSSSAKTAARKRSKVAPHVAAKASASRASRSH
jgi:putative transcriptional regulator